jgi:hypothetical protein
MYYNFVRIYNTLHTSHTLCLRLRKSAYGFKSKALKRPNLIEAHVRLNSLQRILVYEERSIRRAIIGDDVRNRLGRSFGRGNFLYTARQ